MKKVVTLKVAVYKSNSGGYFSVGVPVECEEDVYKVDCQGSTFVKFDYFATEVDE